MGEAIETKISQIDRMGHEIMDWIGEVYPSVPDARRIAETAIMLFIGAMQNPDISLAKRVIAFAPTTPDHTGQGEE